MKGDKGILNSRLQTSSVDTDTEFSLLEFAGTLLGFDDYVSMFDAQIYSNVVTY